MKQPLIEECPCCGVTLCTHIDNVRTVCYQEHMDNGVLAICELRWECQVCGCSWKHGQFKMDEEGGGV